MNRIGKREFYSNPSKYIKPGIFILTSHGKDELKVIVTNISDNVTNKDPIVTNNQPIDTNNTPGNVPNNTNVINNNVTNNQKVTNKVTTLPDNATKEEKLKTAKSIPNIKTADEIPAPEEVTKEYPGIKTQADYESHQARQKEKEYRMVHYGCGCKKTDESLCGKHKRR